MSTDYGTDVANPLGFDSARAFDSDIAGVLDWTEDLNDFWNSRNIPGYRQARNEARPARESDNQTLDDLNSDRRAYDLRPGFRNAFAVTQTWVDQDTSGTFDPDSGERTRKRTRRSHKDTRGNDQPTIDPHAHQTRRVRPLALLAASHNGHSWPLTIILSNDRLRNAAASVIDSWPEQPRRALGLSEVDSESKPDASNHQTRKRSEPSKSNRPNLAGHPEARGCWRCYSLNHPCSLREDDGERCGIWPCELCGIDGEDCEMVTEPKLKLSCNECKKRRKQCSFVHAPGATGPCDQCLQAGFGCIAGPLKGTLPIRISYDRDWKKYPMPPPAGQLTSAAVACRSCQVANVPCRMMSGCTPPVCIACDLKGKQCMFAGVSPSLSPTPPVRPSTTKRACNEEPVAAAPAQLKSNPTAVQRKGWTVTTSLCYPISFNVPSAARCSLCTSSQFSFFGHGARTIEVAASDDSSTLIEIGTRATTVQRTSLCMECTSHRISQLCCAHTNITRIKGLHLASLDCGMALSRLLDGKADHLQDEWCSVCTNLAIYECGESCGLLLCDICEAAVRVEHKGDFAAFLIKTPSEEAALRPLRFRADAELLRQDGLLARYMWHGCKGE